MKLAKTLVRFMDDHAESVLMVLLFTYFLFIITLEVILRYAFNSSTIIGEETARHAFIWLSWIAASQAAKKRVHISISLIDNYLSHRMQYVMAFFYNVLFILLCVLGFKYVSVFVGVHYRYHTLSVAAQYPMYLAYVAVPLGYALMIVRVVQNMVIDYGDMMVGQTIRRGRALF
jgi:TRAP-type C4-dicarboxylate transport system permease small subunit